MAVTYKKIASVTVGSGGAASIEFTSIPAGTYTDLVIKMSARMNEPTLLWRYGIIRFNSSSSNFSQRIVYGNDTTVGSLTGSVTTNEIGFWNNSQASTSNTFDSLDFYLPNYSGSTNKSISIDHTTEGDAAGYIRGLTAGLWSDTSAITSIQLYASSTAGLTNGSWLEYSTATLYGISKS